MSQSNGFISFLRHYGPIPAGDNMYDELIQAQIHRHGIDKPIEITLARLEEVQENFESAEPRNVILTGTAGDGKTFHCRKILSNLKGDKECWSTGKKIISLSLPNSGKELTVVKDLSELTLNEKNEILASLAASVSGEDSDNIYLVAANDGQLLASWRDWSENQGTEAKKLFKIIEDMLVEERSTDDALNLNIYNLSRLDASEHFEEIIKQVVEHPNWSKCEGCELLKNDGSTTCPIRINRDRLRIRDGNGGSVFRKRLGDLMKLARANRMHIPIRDLLLLGVNILLGDRKSGQVLLTCLTAKNRAKNDDYRLTNPYANVFGTNLSERKRQQYQVFNILEDFGIGRETDNKFDDLLIYGLFSDSPLYADLVSKDPHYGENAYRSYLRDYIEGAREKIEEFMQALSIQRQRLFFSLPDESTLDPWGLTVFRASGNFLNFVEGLKNGDAKSRTTELLVRGLNRTFCGMMIDDETNLYLASSGGDGRGRIASLLNYELSTIRRKRDPYLSFALGTNDSAPCIQILDPADGDSIVDSLPLQLTHFEYLVRVASGSLPASFSQQCNEDFLDFKLRLIKRLDDLFRVEPSGDEISFQALTVDEHGRAHPHNIRIRVGS
jgi:hypothetical protein